MALRLEPLIAAKAKAKEKSHTKEGYQKSANPVHTAKELAAAAGVSHDTIHKARVIAERAPEPVKEALRRGDTSINHEYEALTKPHVAHNRERAC